MNLTTEQKELIANQSKEAALAFNEQQQYQQDEKSYIQIYAERRDEFLAKAGVKNPTTDEIYNFESTIIQKEIKDILENSPRLKILNRLVEVGAVTLNHHQHDFPSIELYNSKIKNGMYTLMSIEPKQQGKALSNGVDVFVWGIDDYYKQSSLKEGLEEAQKMACKVIIELKEKEDLINSAKNNKGVKPGF
ncbi:hypothetical protein LLW09_07420 [Pseudomonas paracarnis]|uniref:Uncharacterized protein n=1 Tax=Pseudomonas paracarnis TaxID=2750625 RepID=A0ABU6BQ01_9PSED|nr:hypothetical protein [Pseudomonas paracarnis]MEB3782383.1 hypothetical protein [Pseudomonas paracarnis]